jgi:hypothetical protein
MSDEQVVAILRDYSQAGTDSPWPGARAFCQIQADIRAEPVLQHGGLLILDECADEKAGTQSAGASRQHNGRLGKVDLCQVATCLVYAHPQHGVWAVVGSELFIPEAWFDKAHAPLRQEVGVPEDRVFATKPALGLKMIQRVLAQGCRSSASPVMTCMAAIGPIARRWIRPIFAMRRLLARRLLCLQLAQFRLILQRLAHDRVDDILIGQALRLSPRVAAHSTYNLRLTLAVLVGRRCIASARCAT